MQPSIRDPPRIKVVVRKRPLSDREEKKNDIDIVEKKGETCIVVKERKEKVDLTQYIEEHLFSFDQVFDEYITNEQLYLEAVQPLVAATFEGAMTTVFAYGQTGSGKTHTMMGNPNREINGMYLLAARDIFHLLDQEDFQGILLYVSFYEIYCSKLFDLLNERKMLHCREDARQKVRIQGIQEKLITNVEELMQVIDFGLSVRTTGVTGANLDSSRSHAVLQISLKLEHNKTFSKMSFIDLAGSERGADTIEQDKKTRIDGAEINKSLLALKECIRAIDLDKKHTPFRGSKLTQVLKDSFIGNCRTVMIANVSPGLSCSEHTLNTLRYADRVKELKKMKQPMTKEDKLSQMLMLPRQKSNVTRYVTNKLTAKGEDSDYDRQYVGGGMSSGKKTMAPPPMYRGVSTKTPNINTLMDYQKQQYDEEDEFFEDDEAEYIHEPHQHNFSLTGAVKPASKDFDYELETEEDLFKLCKDHENLIDLILEEEEEVTSSHKEGIDQEVDNIKEEMKLLYEVQKPNSDIKQYVETLHSILDNKIKMLMDLKMKVEQFGDHLLQEERLSEEFKLKQEDARNQIIDG